MLLAVLLSILLFSRSPREARPPKPRGQATGRQNTPRDPLTLPTSYSHKESKVTPHVGPWTPPALRFAPSPLLVPSFCPAPTPKKGDCARAAPSRYPLAHRTHAPLGRWHLRYRLETPFPTLLSAALLYGVCMYVVDFSPASQGRLDSPLVRSRNDTTGKEASHHPWSFAHFQGGLSLHAPLSLPAPREGFVMLLPPTCAIHTPLFNPIPPCTYRLCALFPPATTSSFHRKTTH